MSNKVKTKGRMRRKKGIRKNIFGTPAKPRMSVFRSNKHIYVQVIDDTTGTTLASASTRVGELKSELAELKKTDAAKKVGELAARRCLDAKIETVVFDRNGFLYCGRVAALADGARAAGLKL
ncbi:MAG: 50S ribosomal protein L18 [Deltaproteobacteria bacterium]|nr:MAG: 50S ribosomal protein L18 [Deltaproteobacteria bacterium]